MQDGGKDIKIETAKMLTTLEPRKELILRMRFGIGVFASFSHEKIARQLGISPDEVVELEAEALRDLRKPLRVDFKDLHAEIHAIPKPPTPTINTREFLTTFWDHPSKRNWRSYSSLSLADNSFAKKSESLSIIVTINIYIKKIKKIEGLNALIL